MFVSNSQFDLTFLSDKVILLFLILKKSALFSIIVNNFAKWIPALNITEAVTTGVLQKSCY